MFINPKRLITKNIDDRIKITKPADIVPIANRFDELIKAIEPNLPSFYYWTLKRIDYAINYKTKNVKDYIKLFQRADKPSEYFKEPYDKTQKRRTQRAGSFYLFSKSVAINFYDKQAERIYNMKRQEDINNSKNILRFEIQCNKGKTDYINYTHEFKGKELYNYTEPSLSKEMIINYYLKTIGKGDFYKLDAAIKKVNSCEKYSARCKNNLIDILKLINKCRSVWKARQQYSKTKETFNKGIKLIRKLGINPITIPERWSIDYLVNPYEDILKNYKEYEE